jgi:hypothetical protein
MNSEINFILGLIEGGVTPEEVRSLRKHFWNEGRLDERSATFQTALLLKQDPLKVLIEKAAELDRKSADANKVYLAKEEKAGK